LSTDAPPTVAQLAHYLPGCVLEDLATLDVDHIGASSRRLSGAVLFVDIAGFTKAIATLEAAGGVELERFLAAISAHFERTTDLVGAAGGDVVHFAGDAVLALWPAEKGDLVEAGERAADCGRVILATSEAMPLPLRLSVGAGALHLVRVGADAAAHEARARALFEGIGAACELGAAAVEEVARAS